MVARDAGKHVLWPHYFDRTLTRSQGRRVPLDLAVEEPRAGVIAQAARTLGLNPEVEENARPPALWSTRRGRVLIKKQGRKEDVLKMIARRL